MADTLNVVFSKLEVSATISEVARTERQVLDECHEKIGIAVLNRAQLHFGAVTGYPRFAHRDARALRLARTFRFGLDLSSHRRKEVTMEHVAGRRLDRPPKPAWAHGAHVARRDAELGAASRERSQRIAPADKRQSATQLEVLLDHLELIVTLHTVDRAGLEQVGMDVGCRAGRCVQPLAAFGSAVFFALAMREDGTLAVKSARAR